MRVLHLIMTVSVAGGIGYALFGVPETVLGLIDELHGDLILQLGTWRAHDEVPPLDNRPRWKRVPSIAFEPLPDEVETWCPTCRVHVRRGSCTEPDDGYREPAYKEVPCKDGCIVLGLRPAPETLDGEFVRRKLARALRLVDWFCAKRPDASGRARLDLHRRTQRVGHVSVSDDEAWDARCILRLVRPVAFPRFGADVISVDVEVESSRQSPESVQAELDRYVDPPANDHPLLLDPLGDSIGSRY